MRKRRCGCRLCKIVDVGCPRCSKPLTCDQWPRIIVEEQPVFQCERCGELFRVGVVVERVIPQGGELMRVYKKRSISTNLSMTPDDVRLVDEVAQRCDVSRATVMRAALRRGLVPLLEQFGIAVPDGLRVGNDFSALAREDGAAMSD